MVLWFAWAAEGREVVREVRVPALPEAWFVLSGPTSCEVTLRVGPDGVPLAARPDNCPAVLWRPLEEAALAWRWSRGGGTTTEEIEITLRPPTFSPRSRGKDCLVAAVVDGTGWDRFADAGPRCAVDATLPPPMDTSDRKATAWCAVDVVTGRDGVRSVTVDGCAEGFADAALASVRSWTFGAQERRWRVLVGWTAPDPHRPDFG